MFGLFKKTKGIPLPEPHPTFNIPFTKLYEADGRDEGTLLTADEVSELLSYIEYMTWLTNPPKRNS